MEILAFVYYDSKIRHREYPDEYFSYFYINRFISEFLQWTLPSSALDTCIVGNGDISEKSRTN